MRHALFTLGVALYVVVISQNWAVYLAAVGVAAYLQNGGRLRKPVDSTRLGHG